MSEWRHSTPEYTLNTDKLRMFADEAVKSFDRNLARITDPELASILPAAINAIRECCREIDQLRTYETQIAAARTDYMRLADTLQQTSSALSHMVLDRSHREKVDGALHELFSKIIGRVKADGADEVPGEVEVRDGKPPAPGPQPSAA